MKVNDIDKIILHYVGNKSNGDGMTIAEDLMEISDLTKENILALVNNSFISEEYFELFYSPKLELNPVYIFVRLVLSQ